MKYTEDDIKTDTTIITTKDPKILIDILREGNNNLVSYWASRNPNCPPEVKINWMMKTGKIGKEDPKKHIIEYENNKEDDFQDLKDLL